MSHTPGPWFIPKGRSAKDGAIWGGNPPVYICECLPANSCQRGNMQLIAAAPELLEACKAALSRLYEIDNEITSPSDLYEQIEAAIKKAEGL